MKLLLASLTALAVGGWATIHPDPLPTAMTAGARVELGFLVKQHGVTPLGGLKPTVLIRQGTEPATTFHATPGKEKGRYVAALTFPRAGDWHVTIESGFAKSSTTLPVQKVGPAIASH